MVGGFLCKNFSQQQQRGSSNLKTAEKNVFVMFHSERPSCFGILQILLRKTTPHILHFALFCCANFLTRVFQCIFWRANIVLHV